MSRSPALISVMATPVLLLVAHCIDALAQGELIGTSKIVAESPSIHHAIEWNYYDRAAAVLSNGQGLPGFSHHVATGAPAVQGVRAHGTRKD